MRITRVRLHNFKIFENNEFELRPITLLSGSNSSGKSAILTSLAATLQTGPPRRFPFELVLNGENCSLGSYKDVVRGHSTRRNFSIGFDVENENEVVSIDAGFRYSPKGDHLLPSRTRYAAGSDSLEIQWDSAKKAYHCRISAESLTRLKESEAFRTALQSMADLMAQPTSGSTKGRNKEPSNIASDFLSAKPEQEMWIRRAASGRALPEQIGHRPAGNMLLSNLQRFMGQMSKRISYVGPIRATPRRYYGPDQPVTNIDPSGANCAQLLYSWSLHSEARFKLVAELLRELELVSDLSPKRSGDEILRVLIKPFARQDASNFADVGFGISQVLPIVVADVGLHDGGVLLINQPEVHLHPTSQARLANYMASRIPARQYVVETHSEYLINRFRLLVMKGDLDPADVGIVFLETSADGSNVRKHDISMTRDGKLHGAPKGFFETYYVDSFELALGQPEEDA